MKKVTGIGGVFFKCKDAEAQKQWYEKHLGIPNEPYGTTFGWRHLDDAAKKGTTVWSTFKNETTYFGDASQQYMINYRVENLEALAAQLKEEGVTFVDEIQTYDYGKFLHILDGEGNRVELWEAVDEKL